MKIQITTDFLAELEAFALCYRKASSLLSGEYSGLKKGGRFEFAGHKRYIPGDDFRYIDWNAASRFDSLFMKTFLVESTFQMHFVIDTTASMKSKLEFSFKLAVALAFLGLKSGSEVSFNFLSSPDKLVQLGSYKGAGAIFNVAEEINNCEIEFTRDFSSNLNSLRSRLKRKGLVLIFSDGYEENLKNEISFLRAQRFDVIFLQVLSQQEIAPEYFEAMNLQDCETDEKILFPGSQQNISRYLKALDEFILDWRSFCSAHQVHYAFCRSGKSIINILTEDLQREKIIL